MERSSSRLWIAGALSLCALAVGCGPEEARQVPSAPVGAIAGKVTSLRSGTPLANVKVSVIKVDDEGVASEAAATTAADGSFSIPSLPAGTSYRVRFALDGFVPRFRDVEIPAAAGEYPQGNGVGEADIALAPATGGISGKIFASNARAAAGAKIGIDLRPANYDLVAEVVADASGNYSFTGLPGAPTGVPCTLVLQPYDEDNDGQADYGVLQINSLSFPDVTTRTDIDLRSAANALVLLSSDVDDGEHPAGDVIRLIFNRAVVPDRLTVSLNDLDTSRAVGISASIDAGGSRVVLTVAGGKLAEGTDYQLVVSGKATNGSSATFTRNFRALGSASSLLPAVTNFTVTPDEVDWTTTSFSMKWDMVPGASAYRIYVRDTRAHPAYELIRTVGAGPNPQTTFSLPAEFDTFSGDGRQTPFAFKNTVEFAIVAANALGDAAAPGATFVQKSDNVPPRITGAWQTDGADNTNSAQAKEIELRLSFNEYIDVNTPPVLMAPSGVGSIFEPDNTLMGGKFVITIPGGVNASGAYKISGGADSSGLPVIEYDGTLLDMSQLLANGSFEGCSLEGWNTTVTGTSGAPIANQDMAAAGTCSVRIGATLGATTYQSGTSGIWQELTLPSGAVNITFSAKHTLHAYSFAGHDYAYCALQTAGGFSTLTTMFSDTALASTWVTRTANITAYAGQTVRVFCGVYQDGSHGTGAYFDDLTLSITQ